MYVKILMYSALAKGCTKPGCRVQTVVHSRYQDFPPVPRRRHVFPPCPECNPWISRHLEVATMPYPRSSRREQDGCPRSAHPHPSPPPPPPAPLIPPTHLPRTSGAASHLTLLIRQRGRGGGEQPGEGGKRGGSTSAEEEAVQKKIS